MYKLQVAAFLLLPSTEDKPSLYDWFFFVFLSILSAKTFAVIFKIIHQSSFDIILMDWERPKRIPGDDMEETVVAWRSVFLTNQF